jgi:tellurite resistance protein
MSTAPAHAHAASHAAAAAVRVPVSFFSIPLGIAVLGGAWRAASRAYGVSPWLADALLATGAALWVGVFAAQVVKAFGARDRLREELADPVQGALAALGPASLLFLAAGVAVHERDVAMVLFWIGAAAQLALGVWAVGRWLVEPLQAKAVTPALHLPAGVGNLAVAIAAGAVGRADAGWLFFGVGAVSWLLVAGVLLARYMSAGELPAGLRPLVGLEIAPPALALAAWQSLHGAAPDAVSRALLGVALFVALVVLRISGRLREAPFGPAHWSFAFPLAALAGAALRQGASTPGSVAGALALPLFVAANAVVAVIAFRTATDLARGKLLEP